MFGICDGRAPGLSTPAEGSSPGLRGKALAPPPPSVAVGSVLTPVNPGAEAGDETSRLQSLWVSKRLRPAASSGALLRVHPFLRI